MTSTPSSYILFAYDPGGTTGWAAFYVFPEMRTATLAQWGELKTWVEIDQHILHRDVQSVVFENIVPRSPDFNPIGLEVIGVIKYLCWKKGIPVSYQPNAVIHGIARWGIYDSLWKRVKSQHSKDAISHGIVYLRKLKFTVDIGPKNPL